MALPSTKKRQTSPRSPSPTPTPPLLSNFPPGELPRQVGSGTGASSQVAKKQMSNILGLLNLIDESVDIVEDEVLPGKIANVIALAINHIKHNDSEECYTQEELISALEEQVSALQDESAQGSAVRAVIRMCQCEAHETIRDITSPIRELVVKLLDIAVTESSPNVENQLGELLICILQIVIETTDVQVRVGSKLFYQKLGKKSPHCGSFIVHNTAEEVRYDIDEVDIVGKLRTPRVILVLVCEIQSFPENLRSANIHTAEVAIAQLTTKRLQGVVAISMAKNRSAMIFTARTVGPAYEGYYKVDFKPVALECHDLTVKEGIQRFTQVYYSTLKSLPQVSWS